MTQQNANKKIENLKKEAEKRLNIAYEKDATLSSSDISYIKKLIYELGIYQIELEIQNEKLLHTQQELEKSNDKYYDLFDNAPVGYLSIDIQGQIHEVNKTFAKFIGLDKDKLLDFNFYHLVKKDDRDILYLHLKSVFNSGEKKRAEVHLISKKEREIFAGLISKLRQDDGKTKLCRISVIDIGKQKKQEQNLKKVITSKERLFSVLGHDLRSPLSTIVGYSDLLLEREGELSQEETKKFISIINDSSLSMNVLLNDLVEWSQHEKRKTEFSPAKINIQLLAENCCNFYRSVAYKKNIKLLNLAAKQIVFADANMILTVIRNIVSNALKFTGNGGKISINTIVNKDELIVRVTDTGVGISLNHQKKLFSEIISSTPGTEGEIGSGLGLIICKEFIEAHGSEIMVESEPGRGTSFSFALKRKS